LGEGQETKISVIHHGARLNGDITFINHRLTLAKATNRIDTRTAPENSAKWTVDSTKKSIDIRQYTHIILNARGAPSGDAVFSLDVQPPANEVYQYKYYNRSSSVSQDDYNSERAKAASDRDFFILFTTQEKRCDIVLPKNSGIVDREHWKDYFGPFAGRAFVYCDTGLPNINEAGLTTLQLVDGIGRETAKRIMAMRAKRLFSSIEDAVARTGIRRMTLEKYKYE